MPHLRLRIVSGTFVALAVVAFAALTGLWGLEAEPAGAGAGSMAAMSIDMNTAGNDADTVGSREPCVSVSAGNSVVLDITAVGIPSTNPMIAFSAIMSYDSTALTVSAESTSSFMLSVLPGSAVADVSESPPDTDGSYSSGALDVNTAAAEFGSGVLTRVTLDVDAGAANGVYPLALSSAGHVDPNNGTWAPDVINNATLAVGQSCAAGGFGDVDCSGIINSVDALKVLRFNASLGYTQTEPCVDIGLTLPNTKKQGDVDCSTVVDSVDALKLLRFGASLTYTQTEPCPDIGT